MLPPAHQLISGDPTNHGSNVGAVVLFGLGIFVLIGLLAFLITRTGRRPLRPTIRSQPQVQPMPGPRRDSERAAGEAAGAGAGSAASAAVEQGSASDVKSS